MKTDLEVAGDLARLADVITRWHARLQTGTDHLEQRQADLKQDLAQAEVVLVELKDILGRLDRDSRQSKSLVGNLGKRLLELAPVVAEAKGVHESLHVQVQQVESFGGIKGLERTLQDLQSERNRLQEEASRHGSEAEQRLASLTQENQAAHQTLSRIREQLERLDSLAERFEPEFKRADAVLRDFDQNASRMESVNLQAETVALKVAEASETVDRFQVLLRRLGQQEEVAQRRAEELARVADECRIATEEIAAWRQGQTEEQVRWKSLNEQLGSQVRLTRITVSCGVILVLGSLCWWGYWLLPLISSR